jgi:presenilin-like A22 family membrane protease
MKHNFTVTALLVLFFVVAQLVGLGLMNIGLEGKAINTETGKIEPVYSEGTQALQTNMSPTQFAIYVISGIAIGTVIILLLAKFNKIRVWKVWFFLAVFIAISFALRVVLPLWVAMLLALGLATWKVFKSNIFIHNITEILMYAGIGVFLIVNFDLFWAFIILIAISIYDVWAVWGKKHMVSMAKFQTKSNVFAGLMIPYKGGKIMDFKKPSNTGKLRPPEPSKEFRETGAKTAILGGGDIAFPLLFSGVVMKALFTNHTWLNPGDITKLAALQYTLIITLTTTAALLLLFVLAKKDKFYPAMPFIFAGCLAGFGIIKLLLVF